MVRGGWISNLQRKAIFPPWWPASAWHCEGSPWLHGHWPPWPMENDWTCHYMVKYVKGCDLYNQMKTFPELVGKLMPNWVPLHQWKIISADLIMELPSNHGYNPIIVMVDWLSKFSHVVLTTSNVMVSGVAWQFREHVWKLHSWLEEVISDWGTQFISNFVEICTRQTVSVTLRVEVKQLIFTRLSGTCDVRDNFYVS